MTSTLRTALMGGFVAAGLSWTGGHGALADEAKVKISDFSFAPATLTVPAGTTVTWDNEDEEPHLVVDSGKAFTSEALDTGDRYSFTFTTPGKYTYFCSIHPHMVGTIIVEPRPAPG